MGWSFRDLEKRPTVRLKPEDFDQDGWVESDPEPQRPMGALYAEAKAALVNIRTTLGGIGVLAAELLGKPDGDPTDWRFIALGVALFFCRDAIVSSQQSGARK